MNNHNLYFDKKLGRNWSINPGQIAIYNRSTANNSKEHCNKNSLENLKDNKKQNNMSPSAKKRCAKAINWLLYRAKEKKIKTGNNGSRYTFKVNFVTLTLPSKQIHSDEIIKSKALNYFLTDMKRFCGVTDYVWKAEKQANGNIHFHIITNCFIHYMDVRNYWNKAINTLGYVDKFEKVHGHNSPNSTDIHSFKKVKSVARYVVKYISKADKNGTIGGRIWGLSQDLSKLKNAQVNGNKIVEAGCEFIIRYYDGLFLEGDYFKVFLCDLSSFRSHLIKPFYDFLDQFILDCLNPPEPPPIIPIVEKIKSVLCPQLSCFKY